MPRLAVHFVAWNSMANMPDLFESIEKQTYKDFTVRVVDNGSSDGAEKWLREKYPSVTIIRNTRNLGFDAAHNQALRLTIDKWAGEDLNHCYVLLVNPDIILKPDCFEKLIAEAETHPEAGSFSPKLLKTFRDNGTDEVLRERTPSDMIDSTGLRANRFRWFYERGAGELDQGQFDAGREVFGVSGALALYRASALEDIKMSNGEYFDNDFFAYKEDIDLAWRLQGRGWEARFVPEAVAHHAREMYGKEKAGFFWRLKNRRKKSKQRTFYSTRNHWWLLVKNMTVLDIVLSAPWLVPAELGRFVYVSLFELSSWPAIFEFFVKLPKMLKKRREILLRRSVYRKKIAAWFV